MVEAQQSGELKNEAHLCIDEVNIVCFLLRDELKENDVKVAGLVKYLGENVHKFNRFVKENIFVGVAEPSKISVDTTKIFQVVGSKILGYLAHLQFKMEMLEKDVLPITKSSPSNDIREAELLLNRYHMGIAYSNEKRLLLHGNYVTEKTIAALKKLELLCKLLKEKEVTYCVIFAPKSRLDCTIKQKFKTY